MKTYLNDADKTRLTELFIGGVPSSSAVVMVEQLIQEKVGQALRDHGVYLKED